MVELGVRLQTEWTDTRLNGTIPGCYGRIYSPAVDEIWIPRPYMVSTAFIEPVETIAETDFYYFEPDHMFHRYQELNIGVQCPFEFSYYPFDAHTCKVQFHSSSYTSSVVNYTSELKVASDNLQHALKYDIAYREFTDEKDLVVSMSEEDHYSACGFYIDLRRKRGPAILNIFIPSFLIVLIAFCRYDFSVIPLDMTFQTCGFSTSAFGFPLQPPFLEGWHCSSHPFSS